jgi:hypothetical protein
MSEGAKRGGCWCNWWKLLFRKIVDEGLVAIADVVEQISHRMHREDRKACSTAKDANGRE